MTPPAIAPYQASVRDEYGVITLRQHAREIARDAGLSLVAQAKLSAAISCIGRAVLGCGHHALFCIRASSEGQHDALEVTCAASLATSTALHDLGQSLESPEIRRLPDELSVQQTQDTIVLTLRMWLEA